MRVVRCILLYARPRLLLQLADFVLGLSQLHRRRLRLCRRLRLHLLPKHHEARTHASCWHCAPHTHRLNRARLRATEPLRLKHVRRLVDLGAQRVALGMGRIHCRCELRDLGGALRELGRAAPLDVRQRLKRRSLGL